MSFFANARVIEADTDDGKRHLLAAVEGYYLGHTDPADQWLIVGTGTIVGSYALSNVEVVLW